mmetsp:Transcript_3887/g.9806  ORF Transcript_3887/g.9806 Transcript_3887/m.9806 type:complete len:276 (-) Transcript_3887:91-918(-)
MKASQPRRNHASVSHSEPSFFCWPCFLLAGLRLGLATVLASESEVKRCWNLSLYLLKSADMWQKSIDNSASSSADSSDRTPPPFAPRPGESAPVASVSACSRIFGLTRARMCFISLANSTKERSDARSSCEMVKDLSTSASLSRTMGPLLSAADDPFSLLLPFAASPAPLGSEAAAPLRSLTLTRLPMYKKQAVHSCSEALRCADPSLSLFAPAPDSVALSKSGRHSARSRFAACAAAFPSTPPGKLSFSVTTDASSSSALELDTIIIFSLPPPF